MANTILEVKDLCKTYVIDKRQNNVLKNVNFNVEEGEMVAIMGPSGSGKSTLLYSVSGMDHPTSGEVRFEGEDITKLPEKNLAELRLEKMGFIFQQMYMMKNLTILDNIVLPALFTMIGDLFFETGSYFGNFMLHNDLNYGFYLSRIIVPEMLYSALIMLILIKPLCMLNPHLNSKDKRRLGELNERDI